MNDIQVNYEATISNVSIKPDKDGGSKATIKLEVESQNPKMDFSDLLVLQQQYVKVTIEGSRTLVKNLE